MREKIEELARQALAGCAERSNSRLMMWDLERPQDSSNGDWSSQLQCVLQSWHTKLHAILQQFCDTYYKKITRLSALRLPVPLCKFVGQCCGQ